jgi:hypothetical protein
MKRTHGEEGFALAAFIRLITVAAIATGSDGSRTSDAVSTRNRTGTALSGVQEYIRAIRKYQ